MQKVYLLLRNNQQTGPYSFEELLALHLKPYDLVWIEGKSHGWRYPNEVEALKPYVASPESLKPVEFKEAIQENQPRTITPPPTLNSAKNVFVSMPVSGNTQNTRIESVDSIEQKAEELRKRAQDYTPPQEPVQTNYARDLYNAEEEYTKWVYQKKTTKKTTLKKKTIAIAAISILILSVGWFAASTFFKESSISAPAVVQQKEQATVPQPSFETGTDTEKPMTDKTVPSTADATPPKTENKKGEAQEKIVVQEKKLSKAEEKTAGEVDIVTAVPEENKTTETTPVEKNEPDVVAEAPVEKKKTFKDKISDLFKNKKTEQAESKSGTGTGPSSERIATRRGEEKEAATSITDVSGQVEIKTNKIADSWMMGVKNLKLTLVNRSNLTISSAKVEVLYFSEQDNLLEKKTLSFANIPPGKSQTVSAPDQRLADHIEHKVLFANGLDNAYASQ